MKELERMLCKARSTWKCWKGFSVVGSMHEGQQLMHRDAHELRGGVRVAKYSLVYSGALFGS